MEQEATTAPGGNATSPSVPYVGALSNSHAVSFHPTSGAVGVGSNSTSMHLTVYASIIGANLVFTVIRAILFAYAGLAASTTLHKRMLDTVLQVNQV